jgi:hypothetical protein
MNILITGGTGFIGSALSRGLRDGGHSVVVTTRRQTDSSEMLTWNPPALIPPDIISNIDAVVNLAGESISSGRWTRARKERLMSSRIDTTDALVKSMEKAGSGPKVLISASAIGYYGAHGAEYVTENTPPAQDFLAGLCRAWETEALKAEESGVRVVLLRTGVVLGSGGGALSQMVVPFKLFMGGHIGSGEQWLSWIHVDDEVGIIRHALENGSVSGPLNLTAPDPVTNKEFSSALGKTLGRSSWLPVPGFVLKIALGELGQIALTGQRVIPEKALETGYKFKYPEVNGALKDILG